MLLNITIENFRSIKEPITLDMEAMGQVSELKDNLVAKSKNKLLKSAVIYGANGSGKTNIIKALVFVIIFVRHSINRQEGDIIKGITPFMLSADNESKPSFFELEFLIDETKFRYGFEVCSNKVNAEWLFYLPKGRRKDIELFSREEQSIEVQKNKFSEGLKLEDKVRTNSLFLSVCAQFNGEISKKIINFFNRVEVVSSDLSRIDRNFTPNFIKDSNNYQTAISALQQADFGIENIIEEEPFATKLPNNIPADFPDALKDKLKLTKVLFSERKRYNVDGEEVGTAKLLFDDAESAGTQKYFYLFGRIQDTLQKGNVLCMDELDTSLHPKLTFNIIRMFHDKEINKNGAQLIFTTHDTNLLSSELFRRDQIYFTEKNNKAETDLYSLAEFKFDDNSTVRKDANYEKNYLKGRYGAIPFMGNLEFMKLFANKGE